MNPDYEQRYARNISLPEMGEEGQQALREASVLVIGAGGLGAPILYYLAAAGVGRIGIVDHDRVALSNLQRQILFETADIGRAKAEAAADALQDLNPDITVQSYVQKWSEANAATLMAEYMLVIDGSDNFESRLLANAQCRRQGKPFLTAAVIGFTGQVYGFVPEEAAPCYQCMHPVAPPEEMMPSCAQSGVLGSVAGIVGCLTATEAIKHIAGIQPRLQSQMLQFDALQMQMRKLQLMADPHCETCKA